MHSPGTQRNNGAALERLWLQVCASRGTPAPDPARLAGFMAGLGTFERNKLESILALAARGREQRGDLSLISWATACTRPALLEQLAAHGLAFTGAHLFACSLALMLDGWDMKPRLAQLVNNPGDVATLRALLPAVGQEEPQAEALGEPARAEDAAVDEAFPPWLDDDHAPGWEDEPMEGVPAASNSSAVLPVLPTRFERQRPEPFFNSSNSSGAANARRAPDEGRLRLRLFGKSAAHTLEVTPHRRGGDFMDVHVVTIDSAHALGSGAGYDWARKLVIQLTPEEMPGLIATLMGLTPSVRFGRHGANQAKFIDVRRQEGGLVVVTGERALSYSVPVPAGTIYYVLDLFFRAMSMEINKPGRSVSDVLMLVKSAHGF